MLGHGDVPSWVSASLNASSLSSGVCDRDVLVESECCGRPAVHALKLTEADRSLAVELGGRVPVGPAPHARNPCQIAKNCDHYPASHGQGLPKLCSTLDK